MQQSFAAHWGRSGISPALLLKMRCHTRLTLGQPSGLSVTDLDGLCGSACARVTYRVRAPEGRQADRDRKGSFVCPFLWQLQRLHQLLTCRLCVVCCDRCPALWQKQKYSQHVIIYITTYRSSHLSPRTTSNASLFSSLLLSCFSALAVAMFS